MMKRRSLKSNTDMSVTAFFSIVSKEHEPLGADHDKAP
jgi:hypothetical protein